MAFLKFYVFLCVSLIFFSSNEALTETVITPEASLRLEQLDSRTLNFYVRSDTVFPPTDSVTHYKVRHIRILPDIPYRPNSGILTELLSFKKNAFSRFPNLEKIEIHYIALPELPESILEVKMLKELTLNFCSLTELPEEISSLKQLSSLDITGNKITELPKSLIDLKNLKHLNLTRNGFTHIPKVAWNSFCLKTLDLGNRTSYMGYDTNLPEAFHNQVTLNSNRNNPIKLLNETYLKKFTLSIYGQLEKEALSRLRLHGKPVGLKLRTEIIY